MWTSSLLLLVALGAPSQPLPAGALSRFGETFLRQASAWSLAASPDGRLLASGSGSFEYAVRIWDLDKRTLARVIPVEGQPAALAWAPRQPLLAVAVDEEILLLNPLTGEKLGALSGHTDDVNALAFSRDGSVLVSAGDDKTARVWRVKERRELRSVEAGREDQDVDITADGTRVAVTAGTTAAVYEVRSGKRVQSASALNAVTCVQFTPDGRGLLFGTTNELFLVDARTGKTRWSVEDGPTVECARARFVDKSTVVVASMYGKMEARRTSNGKRLGNVELGEALGATGSDHVGLAVVRGGRVAWARGTDAIETWKPGSKTLDPAGAGHREFIEGILALPDGRTLVTGARDGTIRVWDVESARERAVWAHDDVWVGSIAASADGTRVYTVYSEHLRTWDLATGKKLAHFEIGDGYNPVLARLPSGDLVVRNGREGLRIIKPDSHQTVVELSPGAEVNVVVPSPDGKTLAILSGDALRVMPAAGGPARTLGHHQKGVRGVAWSPDGRLLATAGSDETVQLVDTTSWKSIRTLAGKEMNLPEALAFSPDGRVLANLDAPHRLRFWRVTDGKLLAEWTADISSARLTFLPDGKRVATTGVSGPILWPVPSAD